MQPAVHFPVESGYKWSIQVHLLPSITQLPEKNDICARFRKSNTNTKVMTDNNNSVDLVAKKLQACSVSKISLTRSTKFVMLRFNNNYCRRKPFKADLIDNPKRVYTSHFVLFGSCIIHSFGSE